MKPPRGFTFTIRRRAVHRNQGLKITASVAAKIDNFFNEEDYNIYNLVFTAVESRARSLKKEVQHQIDETGIESIINDAIIAELEK